MKVITDSTHQRSSIDLAKTILAHLKSNPDLPKYKKSRLIAACSALRTSATAIKGTTA